MCPKEFRSTCEEDLEKSVLLHISGEKRLLGHKLVLSELLGERLFMSMRG